ncbi:LOW QUALITY PROTEIN: hypothetical protein HID58_096206, partial [Brassica napus]
LPCLPRCLLSPRSHPLADRKKSQSLLISASSGSNDMTITEARGEGEESEIEAPLLDPESYPSPGELLSSLSLLPSRYKNRFPNFIDIYVKWETSFPCPYYQKVPLSLALSPRIISEIARFKPDIIHASSPGIMVFGALAIAKMLSVPIVMSYHTHVPDFFTERLILLSSFRSHWKRSCSSWCTAANQLRLWNKGVDSESFNPRFRSQEMRIRLRQEDRICSCNGEPEKPLVILTYWRRKSLELLKSVMDKLPEARIAFIGDDHTEVFTGMPAVFTGMLQGEELSQAYASGDVFVMPSESETLGLVVSEAMASGLPVVAARAGGQNRVLIQPWRCGRLRDEAENCWKTVKQETSLEKRQEKRRRSMIGEQQRRRYAMSSTEQRWFWRRKKAELLGPLNWLVKRLFPVPPEVNAIKG